MGKAIQLLWWTGLGGALVGTVAILKEVSLVLRALRDILRLAEHTREAAQGVRTNVAAAAGLAELERPVRRLREATGALASTAASVEQKVDGLDAGAPRRGE